MSLSGVFARIVALIGAAAVMWRRLQGTPQLQAVGSAPVIPAAKPQGSIPTLKMPTAQGWARGQTPVAAPGLKVNAFAAGLKHPRWIHLLPNGDVAGSAMGEVIANGTSKMTDSDRQAVATYLESLPAISNPDAKATQAGFD